MPPPGIDTIKKALYRNLERIPDKVQLGRREGKKFVWLTHRENVGIVENLS